MKKIFQKVVNFYLIFQYNVCNVKSKEVLSDKTFFFVLFSIGILFDSWLFLGVYVFIMAFAVFTVILGKLFLNAVGVFLTQFYKKHSSAEIFETYCGNPFSAITGPPGCKN